jgi:hypothetical protein
MMMEKFDVNQYVPRATADKLAEALDIFDIMYQQMKEAFIRGAAWHTIDAQRDNMNAAQRNAREALNEYNAEKGEQK